MEKQEEKEDKEDLRFKHIKGRANWSILYYYGSYGLLYGFAILYRFFLPDVTFTFPINEIHETVHFTMPLAELMDLIFLGIILSINAFRTYTLLQEREIDTLKQRKRYSFLTAIIIMNFGLIVHMVANQLDNFVSSMENGGVVLNTVPGLPQLTWGIYFWDEIASHLMIGFGFFMLIFVFFSLERKNEEYNFKLESKLIKLICVAVGAGMGFGLAEGQAGAVYFIICVALLIISALKMKKKPFHSATFYFALGYIIFIVIWVLITGLMTGYPYVKEPSQFGLL